MDLQVLLFLLFLKRDPDPVLDYFLSHRRQYRLGMELYSPHVKIAMPEGHHLPVLIERSGFQTGGKFLVYHPGVIAPNLQFLPKILVEGFVAYSEFYSGGDSVKYFRKVLQFSSENLSYGLLSQTYPQNAFRSCVTGDNLFQGSSLIGDPWTRTM